MKHLTITLLPLLILASCASNQSFSKRKYTNGKFRTKLDRTAAADSEKNQKLEKERYHINSLSLESDPREAETTSKVEDEISFSAELAVDFQVPEQKQTVVEKEVVNTIESQTSVESEDQLTRNEKRARSAEILGYTAAASSLLFGASLFLFSFSGFFLGVGTAIWISRAIILIAGVGLLQSSLRNDGATFREKFQKARKRGLYFSAITLLLWLILLI